MTITLERFNAELKHYPPAVPASPFNGCPPAPLGAPPGPLSASPATDSTVLAYPTGVRLSAPPTASCEPPAAASEWPLRCVWADELHMTAPPPDLVEGFLPAVGTACLWGPSGTGKSAVAIDLACRVVCGLPWHGRATQPGVVLYVATEGPESCRRRVAAWAARYGHQPANLCIITQPLNLLDGPDLATLAEMARSAQERGELRMIVVDTLAAVISSGRENDQMGVMAGNLRRLSTELGTLVVSVHHPGKDMSRGMRGGYQLLGDIDVELPCADGVVERKKVREGVSGDRFGYRLEGVTYWTDPETGRSYDTVVAVEADETRREGETKARPKLTDQQETAWKAVIRALDDHSQEAPEAHDIPRKARVVAYDKALEVFRRYAVDIEPRRLRPEFQRQIGALRKKRMVQHADGWLWIPAWLADQTKDETK